MMAGMAGSFDSASDPRTETAGCQGMLQALTIAWSFDDRVLSPILAT
jgi:hypothetical protein